MRSVCPAQNMWSRTTRAFICSQINQRFSPNRDAKAPFNQISRLPAERVVLIKKQGFPRLLCQWQTVLWTQTQKTPPPQSCPPNSLSCKDSVSGRTAISEKVNSGWPSRLGPSGTPEEARGPRRVPLQKEGGELVRNSVPSPAGCILDPAELLKHRGQPSRFLAIQESNPMLPPRWWHQQNTPPPLRVTTLIKTSSGTYL